MMKNLILLSIVLLLSVCTLAQNTKLPYPGDILTIRNFFDENGKSIKNGSISIDGSKKTIGSTCRGVQKVTKWSNICSIEFRNECTRDIIVLNNPYCKTEKKSFPKSIYEIFLIRKHTVTKGYDIEDDINSMKYWLAQTFYMMDDTLIISSSLKLDDRHAYMLESVNNSDLRFNLYYSEEEPYYIIITKDMLKENNIDIEKGHCTFRVSYIGDGECSQITDKFTIEEYKENNSK